jgi:cobalamin-dependent methionine synthase I
VAGILIIGEKLSSSIPATQPAFRSRDKAYVQELASLQVKAGAQALDINTAVGNEVDDMEWAIRAAQEVVDVPICIDSIHVPLPQFCEIIREV